MRDKLRDYCGIFKPKLNHNLKLNLGNGGKKIFFAKRNKVVGRNSNLPNSGRFNNGIGNFTALIMGKLTMIFKKLLLNKKD